MTILVDGKKRALEIRNELQAAVEASGETPVFHIVYVGSDPVIDNYLSYKQKFAQNIGVEVQLHRYAENISQKELAGEITKISAFSEAMIVQLPLPEHIVTQDILNLVPVSVDVDVLSDAARELFQKGENPLSPAVAGAIIDIFESHKVDLEDKRIVLIGAGTLVGKPMAAWLSSQGYPYSLITNETGDDEKQDILRGADIVISGAGVPGLVQTKDVKEGVVIIDAGTSESGKRIKGDVHPGVQAKSSLFTPVPGGIGPMTIAILYQNIVHQHSIFK